MSCLDSIDSACNLRDMSLLELKQEVTKLTKKERQELHAYLIRLQHNTPEWKRQAAKRLNAMKAGRFVTGQDLEARIARA